MEKEGIKKEESYFQSRLFRIFKKFYGTGICERVSNSARVLFPAIIYRTDPKILICKATLQRLMKVTGLSKATVYAKLKELDGIVINRFKTGERTKYRIFCKLIEDPKIESCIVTKKQSICKLKKAKRDPMTKNLSTRIVTKKQSSKDRASWLKNSHPLKRLNKKNIKKTKGKEKDVFLGNSLNGKEKKTRRQKPPKKTVRKLLNELKEEKKVRQTLEYWNFYIKGLDETFKQLRKEMGVKKKEGEIGTSRTRRKKPTERKTMSTGEEKRQRRLLGDFDFKRKIEREGIILESEKRT